ncbi:MAG TPA: hypothetical protein EYP41_00420 [Anaerolineae bacterium]|nr:hypothetical protein [Anaerolineae bacterium]
MSNSDETEIGRTLRASTEGFIVGCRVEQLSAAFGDLVKARLTDDSIVYGLIYKIDVEDDPLVRRLVLLDGLDPAMIEDQRQNRLVPIEMSVLTVGYSDNGASAYGLSRRPPLSLDPVFACADLGEVQTFTDNLGYLRMITRADPSQVPIDQLLITHLRNVYQTRGADQTWAAAAIREVIELLRHDYQTLIPILETVSRTLPEIGD